ncbi:FAD-dependent 5-carboxymethylaminomethyl-2-thiouridine(34) oxidoreductase MnmC [Burkholderiaceae bacterium UC74_6]
MKTQPLVPAEVDFSDPAAPANRAYGDVYHSRAGALEQARHVFLGGNHLPARWAGRTRFVILETGFGLGNNFLATWQAWKDDPARCERLVFVSIEKHPLRREDMQRAHADSPLPELAEQLIERWPPLTPDLHALDFEQGRVQLLLALGDAHRWMRELVADDVDAFYLDGFTPAVNPDMWDGHLLKALGRRAARDATACTWSCAPQVREALTAAGFEFERQRGFSNKGGMLVARHRPRHVAQRPAARAPLAPRAREALVIGAGLAGAACAWALARAGIAVTIVDARPEPGQASSGNPGGLFHGTLNPDDGIHARFNRSAALATAHALRELAPALPWLQRGLLRLEQERDAGTMQSLLDRLHLPSDYVQALDLEAARALSGLDLPSPAWFYPGGGALPPTAFVQAMLDAAKARFVQGRVASVQRSGEDWQLLDATGQQIAQAPLVVLACGHEGQTLLQQWMPELPLLCQRGQLSHLVQAQPRPRLPVAGLGYAMDDGAGGLWCGATNQEGDPDPALRAADHASNLAQWAALAGLKAVPETAPAGRVAWRLATPDRLPLVGGIPGPQTPGERLDQPRFIARLPGLAVCSAFGSRGITWAVLCAQVLAAQATGAPVPLEASLVDAIDPARFRVRLSR